MSIANGLALPNPLSNGTTADAVQVMGDFNYLLNVANRALIDSGGGAGVNAQSTQIHNLAAGTAASDAINLSQITNTFLPLAGGTLTGGLSGTTLSLSSTLAVTGATTLAALTASGTSTLAALTASGLITASAGLSSGGDITLTAAAPTLWLASTKMLVQYSSNTGYIRTQMAGEHLLLGAAGVSNILDLSGTGLTINGTLAVTGNATGVTQATADNSTFLATTAYVKANLTSYAPLASPAFTGAPTAPTPTPGDNSTKLATTAFLATALSSYALLASPAFTGTPTAPTAAAGTSTTQLATTAFVDGLRDVPSNAKTTSYTLALTDRGGGVDFNGASLTCTIPANGSVAFPVGATIVITNVNASTLSIAITTDTLTLAGTTATGTRSLSQNGMATLRKLTATSWLISGAGLT